MDNVFHNKRFAKIFANILAKILRFSQRFRSFCPAKLCQNAFQTIPIRKKIDEQFRYRLISGWMNQSTRTLHVFLPSFRIFAASVAIHEFSRIFRDFFTVFRQFFAVFDQQNFAKTRFKRFRVEKEIDETKMFFEFFSRIFLVFRDFRQILEELGIFGHENQLEHQILLQIHLS